MFDQLNEQQEQMKARLKEIKISSTDADKIISIEASAAREILNVSINSEYLAAENKEMIEDLLVVVLTDVLEKATATEAEEAQKLIKDMLPPGMNGLSGLFG